MKSYVASQDSPMEIRHEAQLMLVPLIRRFNTKPKDFKGNNGSTFEGVEWFDMYISYARVYFMVSTRMK